jgi:hypothetical protein
MRQLSFVLDVSANCPMVQIVQSAPFVRPEEFLSVVNQSGKVKLHALVDDSQDDAEHTILVVGTGHSVPVEHVDALYKIGSILVNENQYGYHLYYLGVPRGEIALENAGAEKTPKFHMDIYWKDESSDSDDRSYEILNALIDTMAEENPEDMEVIPTYSDEYIRIEFFNEEFRHSVDLGQLLYCVSSNSAVQSFHMQARGESGQ